MASGFVSEFEEKHARPDGDDLARQNGRRHEWLAVVLATATLRCFTKRKRELRGKDKKERKNRREKQW
ncbi:hypothetical protein TB1_006432 [Malus domestica]